jgi:hypothetical protein
MENVTLKDLVVRKYGGRYYGARVKLFGDLAGDVGYSTTSAWINGRHAPNKKGIKKLAKVLGVTKRQVRLAVRATMATGVAAAKGAPVQPELPFRPEPTAWAAVNAESQRVKRLKAENDELKERLSVAKKREVLQSVYAPAACACSAEPRKGAWYLIKLLLKISVAAMGTIVLAKTGLNMGEFACVLALFVLFNQD